MLVSPLNYISFSISCLFIDFIYSYIIFFDICIPLHTINSYSLFFNKFPYYTIAYSVLKNGPNVFILFLSWSKDAVLISYGRDDSNEYINIISLHILLYGSSNSYSIGSSGYFKFAYLNIVSHTVLFYYIAFFI